MKYLLLILLFGSVCFAQGDWKSPSSSPQGMMDYRKKAEEKAKSRWTLQDWLAQKERNRMMDLWLGMYSPSPYELIFGYNYNDYLNTVDNPVSAGRKYSMSGYMGFYALALGVEGYYENNWIQNYVETGAMLGLRIAGKAVQNTHFILQFGQRQKSSTTFNFQGLFAGFDMDIYVQSHSGIHANYRYYFPTTDANLGSVTGRRYDYGLFFDIVFVRLFFNWFSDQQKSDLSGVVTTNENAGFNSGLKFFF